MRKGKFALRILQRWKKHIALPLLLAALLVILASYVDVNAWKDSELMLLRHLEGERSALEGVTIGGVLKDSYHRTSFRIDGGEVNASTEILAKPSIEWSPPYLPGFAKVIGDNVYEIYNYSSQEIEIRSYMQKKNGGRIDTGTAWIRTTLVYPETADQSLSFTNHLEYGLAKAGDGMYFIMPTTRNYRGMSGIYKLVMNGSPDRPDTGKAYSEPLVSFSLESDQGDAGASTGIEVLGLEGIGDKLALILVENGNLVIKEYDSSTGAELGEARMDGFIPFDSSSKDRNESHAESYEAYSDPDGRILNLSFSSSLSGPRDARRTILSFDFTDGVQLVNTTKASFTDGEENPILPGRSRIGYKNGKLYIVKVLKEYNEDQDAFSYDLFLPSHFYIYVYEGSSLIYKGELATNANDDNIRMINLRPIYGSVGYSEYEYRLFDRITIR